MSKAETSEVTEKEYTSPLGGKCALWWVLNRKNMILKYKAGIITGFIFGVFIIFYLGMSLVSRNAETINRVLFPYLFLPIRLFGTSSFREMAFMSGIFYAFVGFLVQYLLDRFLLKYSAIATIGVFVIIIVLMITAIVLECYVLSYCRA